MLGRCISINVTTAALRLIDRHGGVDNYLLNTPDEELASAAGSTLKRKLLDTQQRNAYETLKAAAAAGKGVAGTSPAAIAATAPLQ